MSTARKLFAIAGALVAITIAAAASGAGPAVAATMKPLLVSIADEPFTVAIDANAGVNDPLNCQPVPLPAGDLVVVNINAAFSGPVDAYLTIPATMTMVPHGGGEPVVAHTVRYVRLEGVRQNLPSNDGKALRFEGLLRIADGAPTVPDVLYRSAEDPVQLCAEDAVTGAGAGGPVVISGQLLR